MPRTLGLPVHLSKGLATVLYFHLYFIVISYVTDQLMSKSEIDSFHQA